MMLASIFDPVGSFHNLRLISLFLFLFFLAFIFFNGRQAYIAPPHLFVYIASFVMLWYGIAISLLMGGITNDFIDTSYIISFLYLTPSLYFCLAPDRIELIVKKSVLILRTLVLGIIIVFLFSLLDIVDPIYVLVDKGIMFYGSREYSGYTFPYIYFVASPMLVLLLCYECARFSGIKSIAFIFATSFSMILTGTRFSIILALLIPIYYLYIRYKKIRTILIFALLFLSVYIFSDLLTSFFSASESSNESKLGYIHNYINIFSDGYSLLFGQGFNAHVWSYDFNDMLPLGASKTELTYVEIIRVFGLPLFFVYIALLGYLYISLRHTKRTLDWAQPCIIFYGLICTLNPYMFSSNGMIVLSLIISQLYVQNYEQ